MPRPKNKITDPETDIFIQNVEADELEDALGALPSDDTKIFVYLVKPQGRPSYLDEFLPSDFSLAMVKRRWGGGSFSVVAKRPGEPKRTYRIDIEKEITEALQAPVRENIPGIGQVFVSKERAAELLQLEIQKRAGSDPLLMLIMQQIQQLQEKLQNATNGNAPVTQDRKAMLEELMMFKNLFAGKESNPAADLTSQVVSLITKGVEIGQNAGDGGGSAQGGWMGILDKVLPIAQQAINAMQQRPAMPQPRPAPNGLQPAPAPVKLTDNSWSGILPDVNAKPTSNMPPNLVNGFSIIANMISPFMGLVVNAASQDAEPNTYAQMVGDNLPPENLPIVMEYLNSADWFQQLCQLDPRISLQQAWWREFHSILLEGLSNAGKETVENPDEVVQ